jgi:hypothetical protein
VKFRSPARNPLQVKRFLSKNAASAVRGRSEFLFLSFPDEAVIFAPDSIFLSFESAWGGAHLGRD